MKLKRQKPRLEPARFFTNDHIENLKIRVTLRKSHNQLDTEVISVSTTKGLALEVKQAQRVAAQQAAIDNTTRSLSSPHNNENHSNPNVSSLPSFQPPTQGNGESSSLGLPGFKSETRSDDNELKSFQNLPVLNDVKLVKEFSWQQKVFSPREILSSCHLKFRPKTHLDQHYASQIKQLLRDTYKTEDSETNSRRLILSQGGSMICSKVDVDGYLQEDDRSEMITTSSNTQLNSLAQSIANLGRDKIHSRYGHDLKYLTMFVLAAVDLPEDENCIKNYRKCKSVGFEQPLYRLRLYNNGTFDIQPGFTGPPNNSPGHMFKSPAGIWYDFWIENACDEEKDREHAELKESRLAIESKLAAMRQRDLHVNLYHADFEPPPFKSHFRLNVMGELVKAWGFDANDLYVIFELRLPSCWTWSNKDLHKRKSAVSAVSACTFYKHDISSDSVRVCHFGMPIELELVCDKVKEVPAFPELYLQVNSLDFWDRHRPEGYGMIHIPHTMGMHQLDVKMWRPHGTPSQRRRRYFIGGSPAMQNIMQCGLFSDPTDWPMRDGDQGKSFNLRYGFATEPSGTLQVRLNCMMTEQPQLPKVKHMPSAETLPLLLTDGRLVRDRSMTAQLSKHLSETQKRVSRAIEAVERIRASRKSILAELKTPKS